MRWQSGRRSKNIDDRRAQGMPTGMKLGAGGGLVGLIATVLYLLLGGGGGAPLPQGGGSRSTAPPSAAEEELADFVSVVLASTEDTWQQVFSLELGKRYEEPVLVLFRDGVHSACGMQSSAVGPFYCPADNKVYLDLGFFEELARRLGAPGDFAQAYVVGHEVGHHVQNLLGISTEVHRQQQRLHKADANLLSVRLELQADCFAGVWAHHADRQNKILEPGDVEEALNAASAIGDDALQKAARGYVVPDSFTHGTSEQRMRWFQRGLESGTVAACNTFDARSL